MADDASSNSDNNHHDEDEWDAQKENFETLYITENRTLRDATQRMIDQHDFYATPRQWERRITVWGLNKYTTRRERLKQIQAQGRSIHEVAEPGRRQRAYGDALHPDAAADDRNIRRFARRELSRSTSTRERSRSRTNSTGKRPRSTSSQPRRSSAPEDVVRESVFNLGFSANSADLSQGFSAADMLSISAEPTDHNTLSPQTHLLHTQNQVTGETGEEMLLSVPNEDLISSFVNQAPDFDTNQFGYSGNPNEFNPSADFSDVNMEASSPFPPVDDNFTAQDQFASSEMILDDGPSNDTTGATWNAQPPFVPPQIDTSSQYNDTMTGTNTFHHTPTNDMMALQNFEDVSPLHNRNFSVPEIVLQDSTDTGLMQPQAPQVLYRVSSQDEDVYADIFEEIEKFSSMVYDAAMSTAMPSTSQSNALSGMIEYERMSRLSIS